MKIRFVGFNIKHWATAYLLGKCSTEGEFLECYRNWVYDVKKWTMFMHLDFNDNFFIVLQNLLYSF